MPRRAVILAGGKGSRLWPYTTILPKPLLPVGDRPILDIVLRQLRGSGFDDVTIAVGHLAHLIRAVIGDGSRHGLSVRYHEEDSPLGTAGPLATIDGLDDTFLMMNGDVLTTLDFAELVRAHERAGNVLTLATTRRVVATNYGIVRVNGASQRLTGFEEKPEIPFTVSMGVYVLEPEAVAHIAPGERLDLPELVTALLDAGAPVGSHQYDGYWLDMGRQDDFERATHEVPALLPRLLPGEDGA